MSGVTVLAGKPRAITSKATGYFWFPGLYKFSTGEYICTVNKNPDDYFNVTNTYAVVRSTDGGLTFGGSYDVSVWNNGAGEPRLQLADGTLIGPGNQPIPTPPGQTRRFACRRVTFSGGGLTYAEEAGGSIITGFTRDVQAIASAIFPAYASIYSDIVDDVPRGQWAAAMHVIYNGETLWNVVAIRSRDQGRTWTVQGTVGLAAQGGNEGLNENSMLLLDTGEYMCTMRGGSGAAKMFRSYSGDGGVSWSTPEQLSVGGPAPRTLRLNNGVIALAGGGVAGANLKVSFSTHLRAADSTWKEFDLTAHHNVQAGLDPANIKSFSGGLVTTTRYMAVVEASANRLFVVYDRLPTGRVDNDGSAGPNEIYLMELGVVRTQLPVTTAQYSFP